MYHVRFSHVQAEAMQIYCADYLRKIAKRERAYEADLSPNAQVTV